MSQGKTVAVVLGSGGARGYAHLGALQVLAERGYKVVTISGTSMGALVGGIAAAGKLEPYTEWAMSLTQREVWRLMDFALVGGGGVIRAERIFGKVGEILGGAQIEDLEIPFTAVATDLVARREVWFQRGSLEQAIRASIAIPGVITPVVIDGRTLVDGGVLNPVPVEPTVAVPADFTLAVSLLGTRAGMQVQTPERASATPGPLDALASRLRRSTADIAARFGAATRRGEEDGEAVGDEAPAVVSTTNGAAARGAGHEAAPEHADAAHRIAPAAHAAATHAAGAHGAGAQGAAAAQATAELRTAPTAPEMSLRDLVDLSLETMSAMITRYRMASNPADVLVQVPANAVGTLDFHKCAEMTELGRTLTEKALARADL